MPTLDENRQMWGKTYAWSQAGDEWSEFWGSPQAQWEGCIFPRIFPFLRGRVLEIAPGHGRWTQFLQAHCASLIGVDLASSRRAFAERSGMSCLQQEVVAWGKGPTPIDCLSTLINRPGVARVAIENHRFMEEAAAIKRISSCLSSS